MSNPGFSFKQFTVRQDRCAMKVSTDACIQGAWTPLPAGPVRVLDVGAGTGLLSLMVAQRNPLVTVDALELDEAAAAQAAENVADSPFAARITVHHADARTFRTKQRYDLIICNPPFFKDSLLGPDRGRNAARHNLYLQHEDIIGLMNRSLAHSGRASILLPMPEMDEWDALAKESRWVNCGRLAWKDTDNARVHRLVMIYGRTPTPAISGVLVIKKSDGSYSGQFSELLSPFYLRL